MNPDGTLFDRDNTGTPDPLLDNLVISELPSDQCETYAAYNAGRDRFVVNWLNSSISDAAYGQLVKTDGTTDGTEVLIVTPVNGYAGTIQALAANHYCGNDLVVIEDNDNVMPAYHLDIAVWGTCSPSIPRVSFPFSTTNGVAAGANAGDTFTFQIDYWGASDPAQAELWIGLDSDGSYAAATMAPVFGSPPGHGEAWLPEWRFSRGCSCWAGWRRCDPGGQPC